MGIMASSTPQAGAGVTIIHSFRNRNRGGGRMRDARRCRTHRMRPMNTVMMPITTNSMTYTSTVNSNKFRRSSHFREFSLNCGS